MSQVGLPTRTKVDPAVRRPLDLTARLQCAPGRPRVVRPAVPDPDAASDEHVRLIAPDRPGMGRSDPQPGHVVADWPADVAALADTLGLETFGVVGWSAGTPYAFACAAFPSRR